MNGVRQLSISIKIDIFFIFDNIIWCTFWICQIHSDSIDDGFDEYNSGSDEETVWSYDDFSDASVTESTDYILSNDYGPRADGSNVPQKFNADTEDDRNPNPYDTISDNYDNYGSYDTIESLDSYNPYESIPYDINEIEPEDCVFKEGVISKV